MYEGFALLDHIFSLDFNHHRFILFPTAFSIPVIISLGYKPLRLIYTEFISPPKTRYEDV